MSEHYARLILAGELHVPEDMCIEQVFEAAHVTVTTPTPC